MKIKEIMTRIDKPENIISIDSNDMIEDALKKFQDSGKSRLIVQQDNVPYKILRMTDVVKNKANVRIEEIIKTLDPINRVSVDDDIQKVISAQDCQPVTIVFDTMNKPVGIITPSDILRYVKETKATI